MNQTQNIHIEKYLWIMTFQKKIQLPTFIKNDIFNKILVSILIIQLVAKYYQTNNLITQDLWVHL